MAFLFAKFVWELSHGELRGRGPANKFLSLQIETRPLWKVRTIIATDHNNTSPYLKESRADSELRTLAGVLLSAPDGPGSMS